MREQDTAQVVQDFYAAFSRGDVDAALQLLDENVQCHEPGPSEILPWAGTWHGREQVRQMFQRFGEVIAQEQFEIQQIIAQGDEVVVIDRQQSVYKATRRPLRDSAARVFTIRKGKIIAVRVFEDTALYVAAVRDE
jgi:hypothetical protein